MVTDRMEEEERGSRPGSSEHQRVSPPVTIRSVSGAFESREASEKVAVCTVTTLGIHF